MNNIGVFAHDAGAAYLLAHYILNNPANYSYSLQGPATAIFASVIGSLTQTCDYTAIPKFDQILAGTSWQSQHELLALKQAQLYGVKTIVMLDHWTNYRERFLLQGSYVFPDEVIASDSYAFQMADRELSKEISIQKCPNYYYNYLESQLQKVPTSLNQLALLPIIKVLYLSENIAEHAFRVYSDCFYWGYTDITALEYFLEKKRYIFPSAHMHITIRFHPSENHANYARMLSSHSAASASFSFSSNHQLVYDINDADLIIGCNSAAMAIALLSEKPVISIIPPGGKSCQLPHSNIQHLAKF